jgi:flagellar protein FliS
MSEGGPLAQNLSNLYEYIINRLILANSQSDSAGVLEAASLLDEIRGAWFAIGAEVRNAPRVSAPAVVNAAVSPP